MSAQLDAIFKIVITGPYAAGKTTMVNTFGEHGFVTTSAGTTSAPETDVKQDTTVGMDFGVLTLPSSASSDSSGGVELRLFGTPEQDRFDFMWELLAEGAHAYVLVVDAEAEERWASARLHHDVMARKGIPGVLAVNRPTPDALERASEHFADLGLPVLGCRAVELDDVKAVLEKALLAVLADLEGGGDHAASSSDDGSLEPGGTR